MPPCAQGVHPPPCRAGRGRSSGDRAHAGSWQGRGGENPTPGKAPEEPGARGVRLICFPQGGQAHTHSSPTTPGSPERRRGASQKSPPSGSGSGARPGGDPPPGAAVHFAYWTSLSFCVLGVCRSSPGDHTLSCLPSSCASQNSPEPPENSLEPRSDPVATSLLFRAHRKPVPHSRLTPR